tara:strand:+ start:625 stop:1293 length:669 start_codon:yes stop_codon:yes gene_type:complete
MSKENKNGWIKLHREFTKFEWYQDANTVRLFLHLLITANHKKAKWQGNTIDRGQLITSHANLANDLGLTIQNVRTSLLKLKKSENLTIKSTSKFTLLSVCNYDTYQSADSDTNTPTNRRLTDDQQTTHKPLTTNNNVKKNKKEYPKGYSCKENKVVIAIEASAETNKSDEALDINTNQQADVETQPSWFGMEENGMPLMHEPMVGTWLYNPSNGVSFEYEGT